MKTFRLIGMALLAVVMCLNFTSCSDDDEEPERNDDGIVTNQKRLVRIYSDDKETFINEFIYDSKGRVSTMFDNNNRTYNYIWGDGIITENFKMGQYESINTYSLNRNNNLIRSSHWQDSNETTTYTYNSSNQLTEIRDKYSTFTYTWEKDRIVKVVENFGNNDDTTYEYIYSGKSCKGYLPAYAIFIYTGIFDDIIYTHPELIGLRYTQLPDQRKCRNSYEEYTEKYTYTFDKDGYLESCTTSYDNSHYQTVDTYTWE